MKSNVLKNIRFRILTPFLGALVIILITSLWSLNYYQELETDEFESRLNIQLLNNFNHEITSDIEQLESSLFFISNKQSIQKAWLAQDRQKLIIESSKVFANLRRRHHITHFYYHDLNGNNFLRIHSPNRYGDKIERPTLKQSMRSEDVAAGIEFGTFGQFVVRVVIPWKIENRLVGYLELGEEIDHVLARLSKNNDYDLILAIHKEFILQKGLDNTDYFSTKANVLKRYQHIFVINQTIDPIPSQLMSILDSDQLINNHEYRANGREYLISQIEVSDFLNHDIATLFYLVDISAHAQHRQELTQRIGFISLILGVILSLFYLFYSKRLELLLYTNYDKLDNEISQRKIAQASLIENRDKLEELVRERNSSLEQSNQRYQTLFDKTADALLIIEGNNFIDCNQAALEMLGFKTKEELYESHPSELSPEYQSDGKSSEAKANQMIETAFKRGSHRFEWEHKRKNGEIFPVEVLLTAIPYQDSQLLHVVWRDITERKKAAAEIEYHAYYDALTKLPNRKLLLDRLEQAYITSRRHKVYSALLFIDIDRFKSINDSLGHTFGDKLLIESANRIKSVVWDEDTVSRFGGDEFVILLKNLGEDKETASLLAKKIATRIQSRFSPVVLIDNQQLNITVSIGIALFPIHEGSIEDILKHADTAMYSAKDAGRNQIAFYLSEMHEKVINRLGLEKDLQAAIREKRLEVYYQPQFDNKGVMIAVEALLRWQHAELGFINPEKFIAIAEDTGLIYQIGDFVLMRSVSDLLEINKTLKQDLNLSVNISPHQFKKEDFVGKIKTIMENYQLNNNFLTLEVTEGIAIENINETIDKFENLRHLGVRLSLDDFGTGYSSLSYLKRLPINELKIDKSFVFDIQDDPQDALLVKSIINIAHQFGVTAVAEGVETKEQLIFLQNQGCNIYQGYYHSRPLPIEKLRELIRSRN